MENQNKILDIEGIEKSLTGVDSNALFSMYRDVRRMTIEICETLEIEDFVVQTEAFMSPPRWHIGHVTWFYDQLLKKFFPGYKPYEEDYSHYLNSYYQAFGKPFNKSRRGTVSRPTVSDTMYYFKHVNKMAKEFMLSHQMNYNIMRHFLLAFNHEWQHQELLVYDIQH